MSKYSLSPNSYPQEGVDNVDKCQKPACLRKISVGNLVEKVFSRELFQLNMNKKKASVD